jgi:hypothetical protein
MIDVQQKKKQIIAFLNEKGPSLPVRIAKAIDMVPIFTSAILSELLGERSIKTSNLRVGASALYLIPGQEVRLEEHIENLKSVEKEAFAKLKEKKVLLDERETPVMRVALRSLRDFAVQLNENDKIIWKYAFISDDEAEDILNKKQKREEPKKEETSQPEIIKEEEPKKVVIEKPKKVEKKKIEKTIEKEIDHESPEFLSELKDFLNKKKVDLIKEIEVNKKEVVAIVKLKSTLGDLDFLLVAKNKKATNEEEINQAIQRAHHEQMPCLYIIRKEPSKKILSLIELNKLILIGVME